MWDLGSLTRDRTHTPCIGSMESYPVDRQGSPRTSSLSTKQSEVHACALRGLRACPIPPPNSPHPNPTSINVLLRFLDHFVYARHQARCSTCIFPFDPHDLLCGRYNHVTGQKTEARKIQVIHWKMPEPVLAPGAIQMQSPHSHTRILMAGPCLGLPSPSTADPKAFSNDMAPGRQRENRWDRWVHEET